MRALGVTGWAMLLLANLGAASLAQAQNAGSPGETLAASALAALERHCARCHQQGREQQQSEPATFGNILDLAALARTPRLVVPGNADASPLWTQMMRRLMPGDISREAQPTADEILAVRDWIEALPPRPEPSPHAQDASAPHLRVETDKAVYAPGDRLTVHLSASVDCRPTVISVDARGQATVIYPNDFEPPQMLAAGRQLDVPAAGAAYILRLRDPGRERVIGLCNLGEGAADGIVHDFERERFTGLGDYRAFLARAVARPTPAPPRRGRGVRRRRRDPPPMQSADPRQVLRAGAVYDVR